jgi:hypothetical protein
MAEIQEQSFVLDPRARNIILKYVQPIKTEAWCEVFYIYLKVFNCDECSIGKIDLYLSIAVRVSYIVSKYTVEIS